MRKVSIIIVNFNTADVITDCLNSLIKQTKDVDYEIIVVDNNSTDSSKEVLTEQFRDIQSFYLPQNRGFSFANNYAMERCEGEFILLLNPDTCLKENSVKRMIEFIESNPEIGAVGPMITEPDGSYQQSFRRFPDLTYQFIEAFYLRKVYLEDGMTKEQRRSLTEKIPFEVDWISGACFLLRRSVYNEIGGLDARFHLFNEDVDWCLRIRKAGWKVYYLPTTQIVHIGGKSTNKNHFILVTSRYRSKLIYADKHYTASQIFLQRILVIMGLILRLIGATFKKYHVKGERKNRIAAYVDSLYLWMGFDSASKDVINKTPNG